MNEQKIGKYTIYNIKDNFNYHEYFKTEDIIILLSIFEQNTYIVEENNRIDEERIRELFRR